MRLRRADFLRPPPAPWAGWGLLALGLLALGLSLWQARQWESERAAEAAVARRDAERLAALQKAARPLPPTAEERRLQRARVEIERPWLPAMRAVESATTDPVYLLAWNFERGSSQLRLDGEAPSFEHALAYALRLDGEGPLTGATLVSHEPGPDAVGGGKLVRFTVLTRWSPP